MVKKTLALLLLVFNVWAISYLVSPIPKIKNLADSIKSDEPGDTVQIPHVAGFYTNQTRAQVINFYQANYNGLFRIHLNHPPEKSKTIFHDTIQSYYLEEFYLPLKETLYINGFEWENDVFTKPDKRIANKLIYQGKEYKTKVTIRTFPTTILQRLVAFFVTETSLLGILWLYLNFLKKKNV